MQTNNRLRDALERIASFPMPPPIELAQQTAVEMRDVAIAALAEPVRNCEVGTAEEQEKRYNEWLNADAGRAIFGLDPLEWAQMPYGEGGAK